MNNPVDSRRENPYAAPTATSEPIKPPPVDERPVEFSSRRLILPTCVLLGSGLLGAGTRLLRPYALRDGIHYDMLFAVFFLCATCLMFVVHNRKFRWRAGQVLFQLENIALWTGFMWGWSIVHGSLWDDLVAMSIAWGAISGFLGAALLAVFQYRRRKRTAQANS